MKNFENYIKENKKPEKPAGMPTDIYDLYDTIYSEVKEYYKGFTLTGTITDKDEVFITNKVSDILNIIWKHYDYVPSENQLRAEIERQLD